MPDAQPLEPSDPSQLGAYRVTGRIGEGGQGVVYLGQAESGAMVAVKLFHARLGRDPVARDDFSRELELVQRVARFCTAQVLDFGVAESRPYIVSEYVPGPALHQLVAAEGPRAGSALERLAIGTATALVALHDAGVIHRDLKPHNVLIGPDGPRVIDFGIARALAGTSTMTSQVVGTPAYMAPEQLAAGELGFALDTFAWASTIAYAARGRPPFGDDAIPAIINRILNQEPDLDGIEEPLRGLLAECLAKDPARRPSAQGILDRLVRGGARAPAGSPTDPRPRDVPTHPGGRSGAGGPGDPPVVSGPGEPAAAGVAVAPEARKGRRGVRAGAAVALAAAAITAVAGVALMSPGDVSATRKGAAAVTGSASPSGTASPPGTDSKEDAASPTGTAASGTLAPADPVAATGRPRAKPTAARPPGTSPSTPPRTAKPAPTEGRPSAKGSPSARPSSSRRLVELGPGHFTAYCESLGWEWVEYRETPTPGAYCVLRKGDTMYLTPSKRDAGCRWRFHEPRAFHRFKGKSSYCYMYV